MNNLYRLLKTTLLYTSLLLVSTVFGTNNITETFETAGFTNHNDASSSGKVTVGDFDFSVQTGGSLKTVISPAAISLGFDRTQAVTRFSITNNNGDTFGFRGFSSSNQFEMSETVNVSGYLNGTRVTNIENVTIPWPEANIDFSSRAGFEDVDEVRFENSDLYFLLEAAQISIKSTQTITFVDPADITYSPNGTFSATASSDSALPVTVSSTTPLVCSVTNQTVTILSAGNCNLTASQAGDNNYFPATSINQVVTIAKAPQTITFTDPSDTTYSAAGTFEAPANSNSSLAVTINSITPSICSVSGQTVTILTAGNCALTASQAGNSNYLAANDVSQIINIAKLNQVINFTPPSVVGVNDGTYTLDANADSGLVLAYSSLTPDICTVSGNIVIPLSIGNCQIVVSQTGNINYNASNSVVINIIIAAHGHNTQEIPSLNNVGLILLSLLLIFFANISHKKRQMYKN